MKKLLKENKVTVVAIIVATTVGRIVDVADKGIKLDTAWQGLLLGAFLAFLFLIVSGMVNNLSKK